MKLRLTQKLKLKKEFQKKSCQPTSNQKKKYLLKLFLKINLKFHRFLKFQRLLKYQIFPKSFLKFQKNNPRSQSPQKKRSLLYLLSKKKKQNQRNKMKTLTMAMKITKKTLITTDATTILITNSTLNAQRTTSRTTSLSLEKSLLKEFWRL